MNDNNNNNYNHNNNNISSSIGTTSNSNNVYTIHVYDPEGTEFLCQIRSDIAFNVHIKHLFINLLAFTPVFKRSSLGNFDQDAESGAQIAQHYGLQEAASGAWIHDAKDPRLQQQDNTFFFKLKPLNAYIRQVESLLPAPVATSGQTPPSSSYLHPVDSSSAPAHTTATHTHMGGGQVQGPPTPHSMLRNHIEDKLTQIRTIHRTATAATVTMPSPTNHINKVALRSAIESLHLHLKLLMLKAHRTRNDHIFMSSDNLCNIIRIIYRSPTLWALNLLVDYLQRNNTFMQTLSTQTTSGDDWQQNQLRSITAAMVQSGGHSPIDTSPGSTINGLLQSMGGSVSSSIYRTKNKTLNGGSVDSSNVVSLFTLIDQSIKVCASEFGKRSFYMHLLEQYERRDSSVNSFPSSEEIFSDADLNEESDSLPICHSEIIIQTISFINNMFQLAPNPVSYLARLHQDQVLKVIYDLKGKDPNIYNSEQYATLKNNLVKDLRDQRFQTLDVENTKHQILFSDLWASTLVSYPFGGVSSYRWLQLGFRGANPVDDLRVTGTLALRNLTYFSKTHPATFQHLLLLQTEREQQVGNDDVLTPSKSTAYPLAVVGAALSYHLANLFRIDRQQQQHDQQQDTTTSSPRKVDEHSSLLWEIALSDIHWFDQCYVAAFMLFESIWTTNAYSYKDFGHILQSTTAILERVVERLPKSSQDFSYMVEENLALDYFGEQLVKRYLQLQKLNNQHQHQHAMGVASKVSDSPASKFSCKQLITFFGESADMETFQFLPSHLITDDDLMANINQNSEEERNQRIHSFFGQWLSSEHVDYCEKIRLSVQMQESLLTASLKSYETSAHGSPSAASPTMSSHNSPRRLSSSCSSLHAHLPGGSAASGKAAVDNTARILKLNKFFGEKVPIPRTVPAESLSASASPRTLSSSTPQLPLLPEIAMLQPQQQQEVEPKSPEELKSIEKVQRLLGEKIDYRKEKGSVNFAPQPSHVKESKLQRMFGELIPTLKSPSSSGGGKGDKRRGIHTTSNSVVIPLASSLTFNSSESTSPASSISSTEHISSSAHTDYQYTPPTPPLPAIEHMLATSTSERTSPRVKPSPPPRPSQLLDAAAIAASMLVVESNNNHHVEYQQPPQSYESANITESPRTLPSTTPIDHSVPDIAFLETVIEADAEAETIEEEDYTLDNSDALEEYYEQLKQQQQQSQQHFFDAMPVSPDSYVSSAPSPSLQQQGHHHEVTKVDEPLALEHLEPAAAAAAAPVVVAPVAVAPVAPVVQQQLPPLPKRPPPQPTPQQRDSFIGIVPILPTTPPPSHSQLHSHKQLPSPSTSQSQTQSQTQSPSPSPSPIKHVSTPPVPSPRRPVPNPPVVTAPLTPKGAPTTIQPSSSSTSSTPVGTPTRTPNKPPPPTRTTSTTPIKSPEHPTGGGGVGSGGSGTPRTQTTPVKSIPNGSMVVATNDHSPSVSTLISVFGERIQRR
ncbi:hypothetical protein SAMD00019534_040210 [Acytostelium subglobosum LB1]|uniref:hypothetical protein n=1 Tax=Acytostelium subglobosum LB1 TaxID=1410327 RepID=UPI000644EF76|nr:hypothetical protein SAMD00019534_040210 [Acytostelium subglobosum LB1]GAM20846.1 hypothetical protein SAMD00019534_040210 [Acytostelium subglobosum LB1]|eukprot:XP_012755980.1 hypothetical protein SAMD00019534_040210 [Acytostelium subglobosum LB1]